jgi:ligand-binding sensor domain-containing protein
VLTTWTTDQGLPQNFIRAITQTADGFLWVGTMNGLARFDGLRFRGFSKDGPSELQDNIIALAPDSSQGLWIATATCLFHYADQKFQPILLSGNPHYRVEGMTHAQDGGVWLFAGGKLFRSRGGSLDEHPLPATTHSMRDFAETKMARFGSRRGNQFSRFAGNAEPAHYPLAGARMVYADAFGGLFAGDGHKLFRFDGRAFSIIQNPGMDNFVSVLVDHRRQLWMASGSLHGVSRNVNGVQETFTMADGLTSNDVRLIFEDRSGDIWLGTISGLQRLHKGGFTTYTALDGLPGANSQFDSIFFQGSTNPPNSYQKSG